ncbi:SDR family oxidoreductase [Deinococcus sp. Arct2-2]|uniref:SDR family oxidoreductase n=1 Tax=Deinococcus sp. Arct2-2 TaxID=2568653 RepID=UPI0010A4DA5F|nr:SDR family oxidoreductase [Deinococcus sp. Arct2-2]THF67923.1 SDR family oxidoreductase [Deinococcus sp. Arct2-2]
MRVFVTGATGFVGSAVVSDLLRAGHQVLGLARTDEAARSLSAVGAEAYRGNLEDPESLRRAAAGADGVIHTAFNHDFSNFAQHSETDRRAIQVLGEVLEGTGRPLIITSGLPITPNRPTTEDDALPDAPGRTPRVSEQTALSMVERGVRAVVVRMPQVHDRDKQGLATFMIALAREKGVSAYVGADEGRWPAVHRLDVAPLYRLALEKGVAGARYHAVAEESLPVKAMAQAIGQGLGLPVVALSTEDAAAHFGWLAFPVAMAAPASSALTQQRLGWRPAGQPGFLDDLEHSSAFQS